MEGRQSALRFEENIQVTQQPQSCLAVLSVQWHVDVWYLQPEASQRLTVLPPPCLCHLPPFTAILGPVSLFCHIMHFCVDQEKIHLFYNSICNNPTIRHAVSSWRVSGQGIFCFSVPFFSQEPTVMCPTFLGGWLVETGSRAAPEEAHLFVGLIPSRK